MKSFIKFIAVMLGIVLLSAFLAPLLFDVLPYKFERIFNRLIMIFTIAAVVLAVRAKKFSFPLETLAWKESGVSRFLIAFAAGLLTLVSVSAVKAGLGMVHWQVSLSSPQEWAQRIAMSLLSALVIGVIEEMFFRGFFFSMLQKKLSWPIFSSIVVTNLFYALIHFTGGKKIFIGPDPTFSDSLRLLAAPFRNLTDVNAVFPGALGLFIFGVVLTILFLKTRSLYPCIGLHAGCVFFLKMDGVFLQHTDRQPHWIYGSGQNYDGLLGWAALFILGVVLTFFYKRKQTFSGNLSAAVVLAVFSLSFFVPSVKAAESSEKTWVSFNDDSQENPPSGSWESPKTLSPLSPVNDESVPVSKTSYPVPKRAPKPVSVDTALPETSEKLGLPASLPEVVKKLSAEDAAVEAPLKAGGNPKVPLPSLEEREAVEQVSAPVKTAVEEAVQRVPETPAKAASLPRSVPVREPGLGVQAQEEAVTQKISPEEPASAAKEIAKPVVQKSNVKPGDSSEEKILVPAKKPLAPAKKVKVEDLLPQEPAYEEESAVLPEPSVKPDLQERPSPQKKSASGKKKAVSSLKAKTGGAAYFFASHLAEVQGILTTDKEDLFNGVWAGDRLVFQADPPLEITVKKQITEGGSEHEGISFRPAPGTQVRLHFPEVPPSSHLTLHYGFEPSDKPSASKTAVYVKVWLGEHPLKRIRVFNEKGWKEEVLDMGPAAFLKTPIMVTFDITSDDKLDQDFNLSVSAG